MSVESGRSEVFVVAELQWWRQTRRRRLWWRQTRRSRWWLESKKTGEAGLRVSVRSHRLGEVRVTDALF
ncbi:hypothetical protein L2E82_30151 [Cichorium intybus]|uniref:Uncharacterized protein n=1 Tax=Cichorium intybus TaxID=13427 RepID=A0ACB9CZL0_CICIN|nr:hypothetical protein L2E82_30151 [Cichorium intybus]